jgi:hypothetical protein
LVEHEILLMQPLVAQLVLALQLAALGPIHGEQGFPDGRDQAWCTPWAGALEVPKKYAARQLQNFVKVPKLVLYCMVQDKIWRVKFNFQLLIV